jgi:hypothetical protein
LLLAQDAHICEADKAMSYVTACLSYIIACLNY